MRVELIFMVAGLIFAGCGKGGGAQQAPQTPPPPIVTVAPVEQKRIIDWEEFTGRTAPVEFVEVRPRISGHVHEIRFKAGQMVKKGDVLFVIDPRWARAELARRRDLSHGRLGQQRRCRPPFGRAEGTRRRAAPRWITVIQ